MKKKLLAGILCAALAVSCAACGSNGSTGDAQATKESTNELTVATNVSVSTMDSTLASDSTSIWVLGNIQEGLYQLDENNVVQPALAKEMSVSDDGLTYTFKLRDDAKWSNGDPVTAGDFVYAWKRMADPATASSNEWMMELAGIKNCGAINQGQMDPSELGVKAVDDTTLEVTLDAPCPYLTSILVFSGFFPLNEKFVTSEGDNYAKAADKVLANGAYMIDSWDVGGNTISIKKNPEYYDADKVSIEEVNFRTIADKQEAAMAYDKGEVDYAQITGVLADKYKDSDDLNYIQEGSVTMLMCNFDKPGLDNQNFREALGYAINRQELVDSVLKDGSSVIGGMVPAGLVSNSEGEDFRAFAGNFMETDKEKAKEYWEKAKEETDVRTFTLLYDDGDTNAKVAAYIQSELESTLDGLTVELQAVPFKTRVDKMGDGDYEVCLMKWGPDYADPITILSLYTPGNTNPNYSHWTSEEFSTLLADSNSLEYMDNEQGRWDLLKQMDQLIVDEGASLPLYQVGSAVLQRSTIQNATYSMCGTAYHYKDMTIETAEK